MKIGVLSRTEKARLLSIVLVSVLTTLPVGGCDTKDVAPARTQIVVADMAGRRVSVSMPVEKVVLGYAKDLPTFAAVAGEGFLSKIVGFGLSRSVRDQDTYLKYKEKFPGIEAIPDVGSHPQGTFSVEKVISLRPDVVIFPLWVLNNEYVGVADDLAKMASVGIATVFVDYWEKPFDNTIPSTLLLGTLLGREKRAQAIADFCQNRVGDVASRLERIDTPKPKVYVENGSKGPSEYSWTCGNYAWGVMVAKARGMNIAEGIISRWGQINPEYLLKTDPDVIIIAEPKPPGSMKLGCHPDPEESKRLLSAFAERPGWNTFSAVKNGRVYGVFDSYLIYNIYNFAALEAIAKWFYPDEFKDLDPEADLRDFHQKFLPVAHNGVWMIGMQD